MTQRIAIFPGSFDPFTNGHLETVRRASHLFDKLIIAVMTNTSKQPLFTNDEKLTLIRTAVAELPNVSVVAQDAKLTVRFAEKLGAQFILRGIRNVRDFEYEEDIAAMNKIQAPQIETVFLLAAKKYAFLSSSLIKEVAKFGGNIEDLVPPAVACELRKKYKAEEG
ncbi:pantetheine-phosphate adenylyltransferase [Loigolactobacillus backii]|uniref:Phosphopantetheine adenylyltransferase n=1 Tax=Loigolactobacillus backii TaxID=375175 RepID=A0A192H4D4_9LACO|nr:pantetheine-phosphate adenylyltransferase [Loigolactobacillus backii]ANK59705.1 pantetheine-phosphate adenylyltransferase [Loigolactobacillus backii]ANK63108.1 pantetheine-phosphate adenylyltransferase [Loigolactobacillus backii]ANK64701.1 pantetheine-phosphate adenylyltransferase [Loigolactobacillus backii]ANK66850.1 pantetheine-phosphate adenylyltransferase [Loigolactobacillus backii]ANK69884.1 pantetheine-phosphate adenylyltransferase [Loigolactobacillus backii]